MRKIHRIAALALALLLALAAVPALAKADVLGEPLDDFTVDTLDGSFTLSEALKDHELVLINLWATWCPPCESEFPFLEEAYEQYADRVAVVALSADPDDTPDMLREYAEEHGLTFPIGSDTHNLFEYFRQSGIPTNAIVDRFGCVAFIEAGAKTSAKAFTDLFDTFLDEGYTETKPLAAYTLYFYDQDYEAVPGCVVNFCTDELCSPVVSDEYGAATFMGAPDAYHVKVLKVPEGYVYESDEEMVTTPDSTILYVELKKQ